MFGLLKKKKEQPRFEKVGASDVEVAYKLLLGRPPESAQVVAQWCEREAPLDALATGFLASAEFRHRWSDLVRGLGEDPRPPAEIELLERHQVVVPGEPDFITNFLGVRTRIEVLPTLAASGGHVEGLPIPCNFHGDIDEWVGSLLSVEEARSSFVVVELGAGWGPWVVSAAVAARRHGIEDIRLVAVEADPGKLEMIKTHMRDNNIDPAAHTLVAAVVAATDGRAHFPVAADPSSDWGAAAVESGHGGNLPEKDYRGLPVGELTEVAAVSLASLLSAHERVDLVHCDIQGGEATVLRAALPELTARVRRLVVGTHGRAIEAELFEILAAAGWRLETDRSCRVIQDGSRMALSRDGCQVWSNPRLGGGGLRKFLGLLR